MINSSSYKDGNESSTAYYESIIDPFNAPLVRVPGSFQQMTQTLRDKTTFQITIGAGANDFVGFFAPENSIRSAISQTIPPYDWLFLARSSALADYSSSNYHTHLASGPAASYASRPWGTQAQYSTYWQAVRLVSAGLRIRYIGRQDAEAGLLSCGFSSSRIPQTLTPMLDTRISELTYAYRGKTSEGLRCSWIPSDFTDQSFINVPSSDSAPQIAQNVFFIHGFGIPEGTVLDVEVVRNYEYFPAVQYVELLKPNSRDQVFETVESPSLASSILNTASSVISAAEGARSFMDRFQSWFGNVSYSVPFGK